MATLTKSRARQPVEDGVRLHVSWSNFLGTGERFSINLIQYRVSMTRDEARVLYNELADKLADTELFEAGKSVEPDHPAE